MLEPSIYLSIYTSLGASLAAKLASAATKTGVDAAGAAALVASFSQMLQAANSTAQPLTQP
eukprot:scaffold51068_cov56-Phaeocystis_antarctica.AAC.3